jgi:peptidoglycan-associated lipoprotein
MKMRIGTLLLLGACAGSLLLLGSGCSKKPVVAPDASAGAGGSSGYPKADGSEFSQDNLPAEGSLDDASRGGAGGLGDNASDEYKRLHGRSSEGLTPVYFDFDQAVIRPDMTDRMVMNAEFLKQSAQARIVVEGNTDERGTNEYNLALGERRAQNARQYLVRLGINADRMRTISYGEERPLFMGQDEDSYSHNRRADFVIE